MRTVYHFNPENDLALAHGGNNYVPPPHAVAIRRELAALPALLMNEDDENFLLIIDGQPEHDIRRKLNQYGIDCEIIRPEGLKALGPCRVTPWGWSLDLRRRLVKWGIDTSLLPTAEQIERWRSLAHRRTTITVHRRLGELLGKVLSPVPEEFSSIDELLAWAQSHPGGFVKAPWSGSGSGVWQVNDAPGRDFEQWARGIIRRQGSVLAEVGLDKVLDCAIEFKVDDGGVNPFAYSVFRTDSHNQFVDAYIDTKENLRRRISDLYPTLDRVETALTQALGEILLPAEYQGLVGVDMLLYRDTNADTIAIDPCVEINLRATMGMVAAAIARRTTNYGTGRMLTMPAIL